MSDTRIDLLINIKSAENQLERVNELLRNTRSNTETMGRSLQRSIDATQGSLRNMNNHLGEQSAKIARLRVGKKKLSQSYDKNRRRIKELDDQILKLEKSRAKQRQNIAKTRTALGKLRNKQKEVSKTTKQGAKDTKSYSGSLNRLSSVARRVAGVFGVGLGIMGVVRVLRSAISTIRDFELAQKQLQAVSGATEGQMSSLSREAIRVGSASIYGAEKVSLLQVQLSKMGFSVPQIMDMTESITRLAVATQEDLGKAAETVAFTIRAYQLDAEETTRVTDTLAKSFTSSALDLEKFRQSIKYIGPIAKQANFDLAETTAVLGALADAGISGSLAGTSMRNIIFQLSDSTSELSTRTEKTIKSFDDFAEALWVLHDRGTDLEDVFQMMDRRAASSFTMLLENVGSVEELKDAFLDASGAAEEMADIQMESLAYKTKQARRAWEGFVLSLDKGEGALSRSLKGIVDDFSDSMEIMTWNMNRQSRAIGTQIDQLEVMVSMVEDSNVAFDRRVGMLRRLQSEYPEYFKNIRDEIKDNKELAEAIGEITGEVETLRETLGDEFEIAFMSEEIERTEMEIERLNDKIVDTQKKYMRYRRGAMSWLEKGAYGLKYPAGIHDVSERVEWDIERMQDDIKDLTEALKGMGKEYEEVLYGASISLEAFRKHIEREPLDEMIEIIDEFVGKYKELRDELGEELPAIPASKEAANQVSGELKKAEEEIKKQIIKIQYQLATLQDPESLYEFGEGLEERQLIKQIKELTAKYDALRKAQKDVTEAHGEYSDSSGDDAKDTKAEIQEELKLEEKRLQLAFEGTELEKQLAEARRRSAIELARKIHGEKTEEGRSVIRMANLEYEIAMQETANAERREARKVTQEQLEVERQLMKVKANMREQERQLAEIGVDERDLDAMYEIEEQRLKDHYKQKLKEHNQGLEDEKKAIEDHYGDRIASMKISDKELTELSADEIQKRNDKIKELKEEEQERLNEVEEKGAEEQKVILAERNVDIINMERQLAEDRVGLARSKSEERLDAFRREQERETAIFESKSRSDKERREFERSQHQEMLEMRKKEQEAILATMKAEKARMLQRGQEEGIVVDVSGIERDIVKTEDLIDTLSTKISHPEFDMTEWNNLRDAIKGVLDDVGGAIADLTKAKEDAARRERELLDRNISETQRALETELKLREQGFASNVQAKQAELENMRQMRAQAQKEEEEAMRRRRIAEAAMQTMNILSSASQIIKQETLKGPVGLLTAAGAIGSLFALWRGVKAQANTSTQYKKGGHFMLGGNRHSQGGTMIAPGHEAEKGELVSVFNRGATRKHAPQIKALTDAINTGNFPSDANNINVFSDNKDVRAIRRHLERGTETYANGYRIIKKGNKTTRCRLN